MADALAEHRELISLANRLLTNEGIMDAFGHVSMRHPTDPTRFLMSRYRPPELVEPADVIEFTLEAEPVDPNAGRVYGERIIHGSIYQARPDVMAVCHHHAPSMMPYAISRRRLMPVFHLGAGMGTEVPFWDSRDEFGDTALVVVKPDEGASLARALGPHWTVLMGRHGATVCGTSVQECCFRTIYGAKNAELQTQALVLGHVEPLTDAEAELARTYNLRPGPIGRAWDYWTRQLAKAEGRIAPPWMQGMGAAAPKAAVPPAPKSAAKPAPAKKAAVAATKPAAKSAAKPKLPLRPLNTKGKGAPSKAKRR